MSVTLPTKPESTLKQSPNSILTIEADHSLAELADDFASYPAEALAIITRHGNPLHAVLSWDYFESLKETLEVMGDPQALEAIRHGQADIQSGRTYDWEDVKRELNLVIKSNPSQSREAALSGVLAD